MHTIKLHKPGVTKGIFLLISCTFCDVTDSQPDKGGSGSGDPPSIASLGSKSCFLRYK